MSKFVGDLINDVINMFVFFILSVLTFAGKFGRNVTTKLGWADNFDSWKDLNQIPCYALTGDGKR